MKALNFFGLCTLLLCIVACSKSNESEEPTPTPTPTPPSNAPTITIDNSILTNGLSFTDVAGDNSITFTTDADWTLSVAETRAVDWCIPSATSGVKGTATVKFSVTENTGYDNRKAAVTIKAGSTSKTFTISQKQKDALLVTTDKYEVEQSGATIEVEVKANIDYQIEIAEDAKSWIKESTTRALTSHKHAFVISASDEYDKREGEIRVISGDKQEVIKVYQAGGAVLLLSQNEYVVSDAGETISVELKSNFDFGVQMPEVDWITEVTDTRSASTHTLKYDIAPNETYDSRSAEIIFYDKNSDLKEIVNIEQVQKDALILSKSEYTIPSEGETIEVLLQSNVKFDVSIDADWISQVEAPATRGLEEYKLYFKVDENTLEEERSASITITNTDKCISQVISIGQASKEKVALMVEGWFFNSILSELSQGTSNIKKIECVVNEPSIPSGEFRILSSEKSYYTIYATYDRGVVSIITAGDRIVLNSNSCNMFEYFTDLIHLDLSGFDTSKVANMNNMFAYCKSLKSLNLLGFDTSNAETMSHMFLYCSSLTTLDLDNFCTNKLTDMSSMFARCESMQVLNLSNFNTANVTDMNGLFYGCSSLTTFELSNFSTIKLTDMSDMFGKCESMENLNLSSFNTENVTDMSGLFAYCPTISTFNLSIFDTSNVINMRDMFKNCNGLRSVGMTSDLASVKFMDSMFENCISLSSIDLSNVNLNNIESMNSMFKGCSSLKSVDFCNNAALNIKSMDSMFEGCKSLSNVNLSNFGSVELSSMNSMFRYCNKLESVDLTNFGTTIYGVGMSFMFEGCSSLVNVDLAGLGDVVPQYMICMFSDCTSLKKLDLSNFDTSHVEVMWGIFKNCSSLSSLNISSFNTSNVTTMQELFYNCSSLTALDLSHFDTSKVTFMWGIFENCDSLVSLDISNFDVSQLKPSEYWDPGLSGMFRHCSSLKSLDLSSFDTTNISILFDMFAYCSDLTYLNLSNFTINESTDCVGMFNGTASYSKSCTIIIPEDSYQWVKDQLTASYFTIVHP